MLKKCLSIALSITLLLGTTLQISAQSSEILTNVPAFKETVTGSQTFSSAAAAMDAAGTQIAVIGADDLAVIGTVLGIAASLKSLFSSNSDDEALKKLSELRGQQGQIIELLTKVITILENLDVLLKGITRDAFVFDLRADISSTMVQYYETRSGLIADPAYKNRALERFKVQYDTLSHWSRKMMQYGFGGYNTIGTAMFFEADLASRLQPRIEQLNSLYTYRDYFTKAKDPAIENSVGATHKYLSDVVNAANAILTAADQALTNQRRFPRGEFCGQNECECGWKRTCFQTYSIIHGDRNSGYSHAFDRDSYRTEGSCRRCPIEKFRGVSVRDKSTLPQLIAALPPVPQAPPNSALPDERAYLLNQTRAVLAEAKPQLEAAQKALDTVNLYLAEVERRIRQLGG